MSVQPLSEREILIAQGKDPDAPEVAESDNLESQVETQAETQEGEGDTEVPGGTEAASATWYNDTTKGVAAEYGLNEDDLKAFSNGDEFKKTVAFLERQRAQLSAGKAGAEENKAAQEAVSEAQEDFELDVEAYKKAGFDEETIKVVEAHNSLARRLRQQVETFDNFGRQVEELRQAEMTRQQQSFCNEFHAVCDTLEEGLVGRSADKVGGYIPLSETADANRRKLFDAYVDLYQKDFERAQAEAARTGRDVSEVGLTPSRTLIENAKNKALGQEIVSLEREKVQRDLQKQSRMRRPTSGASPRSNFSPAKAGAAVDPVTSLINDPDLVRFWNKAQG